MNLSEQYLKMSKIDEAESTVSKDVKSALNSLMLAEGSLYHAVDDSSQMDFNKELDSIYKDVKKAYDSLIKLDKKNKISEAIESSLEKDFTKALSGWKIEDKNGVLVATKKDGDRLHTITFSDESQENKYYALEYKESDMKGNDVNYDTLTKSKGVKSQYVIKEVEKFLKLMK